MFPKLAITFAVILYAIAVPILEFNATHVFNPDWTPHALIHEVWQLFTNSSLGILCLWLTWNQGKIILSTVISLFITGSFLIAFALQDTYGGSMKFLDGSEKTLLGFNIGVIGFGSVVILLGLVLFFEYRKNNT
ncbi:MAG: hypothetical protein COA96_11305 [SAR86 cluster bacterium]|uniref:Uncharacterized protein n=1 Tax=SAR86 cluster bacterium TaxID=2030880 RepID=A0A2A5AWK1_9GAMM|nr:MAG: hypothetical protein COA96_11305 [SAR86 cluster bacterium]